MCVGGDKLKVSDHCCMSKRSGNQALSHFYIDRDPEMCRKWEDWVQVFFKACHHTKYLHTECGRRRFATEVAVYQAL